MTEAPHADYLTGLLKSWSEKPARPLSWFNDLRAHAIDRVSKQAFPTKRDEEWRFTDISRLNYLPYLPARPEIHLQLHDINHLFLSEAKNRLVFVDGYFHQQLSIHASIKS